MLVDRTPYNIPYVPKYSETVEFFVWFKTMFKEKNKSAEFHFQLIDFVNRPDLMKSVSAVRGGSKSTTIGIYWLIFLIWKGHKQGLDEFNFILHIMDTATKSVAHFDRLLWNIENSEVKDVLEVKRAKVSKDGSILKIYNSKLDRTFTIAGLATGQNIRSMNIENKRPEIIICDDVENRDNTNTTENRETVRRWFYEDVQPAGIFGVTQIIFIGTPLHEDSLLRRFEKSETVPAIKFPIAEKFTGKEKPEEIISCWKDRFKPEYIIQSYKTAVDNGMKTSWFQEYMLQVTGVEDSIYKIEEIRYFKERLIDKIIGSLNLYLSIDLAISEKETAHFTSITVIGISSSHNWFVIDNIFGRFSIDEVLEHSFKFIFQYNIENLAMEQVNFQKAYKYIFEQRMFEYGLLLNIITFNKGAQNTKLTVFKSFAPIVNKGHFAIAEPNSDTEYAMTPREKRLKAFKEELIKEMEGVTEQQILAEYDDVLDSVAQLTQIKLEGGYAEAKYESFSSDDEPIHNPYAVD